MPKPFRASLVQLVEDLRAKGAEVHEDAGSGELVIASYRGRALARPVPLRITSAQFDVAMERDLPPSSPWGAGDDPVHTRYKLLLIGLEEDLTTDDPPSALVFDGHGLATVWPSGHDHLPPT